MSSTSTAPNKQRSFAHRLYTGDFQFDFIARRRLFYTISIIVVVVAALAVGIRGLNLGVEFEGGSVFQAPVQVDDNTVRDFYQAVNGTGVTELDAQVNTVGDTTVRIQTRSLSTDEVVEVRGAIAERAGTASEQVAYSLIGPSWGQQITQQAVIALIVFLALVSALIWLYFREWKMSLSAMVALMHDLVVTVGLYALAGFTVTPATLIAVLTILGYSLYDTVVVFDMVREQTRGIKNQSRTYSQAANAAINQVLVRSINTTIIAVLPVVAILVAGIAVLGGEGPLADLGLAMFIGMVSGAYSSICLATPMLAQLREREPEMRRHRTWLEKSRRRGRAKVSTVTAETVVTPAGAPITAVPADGVLEFAGQDVEFDTADPESIVWPTVDKTSSGPRDQRRKQSRADRRK